MTSEDGNLTHEQWVEELIAQIDAVEPNMPTIEFVLETEMGNRVLELTDVNGRDEVVTCILAVKEAGTHD